MEHHSYQIRISNICLDIQMDHKLDISLPFIPFVTENKPVDYRIQVESVNNFSKELSNCIAQYDHNLIYKDVDRTFFRGIVDETWSHLPYAISIFNQNDQSVVVEYLDAVKERLLNLVNCFCLIGIEKLLIEKRRLWIHASLISTYMGGILFSGPSGIGKSTQSDLWMKYRNTRVINGDRPILSCDDGTWLAWGAPYAGSSRVYLNESCPITAIVMLKQTAACSIRRLDEKEAFRAVWSGLTVYSWDSEFVSIASELAIQLINDIPVYELSCTPDIKAVELLETTLRKDLKR